MTPAAKADGQVLGYVRVSTGRRSLDARLDALHTAGSTLSAYRDTLSGT